LPNASAPTAGVPQVAANFLRHHLAAAVRSYDGSPEPKKTCTRPAPLRQQVFSGEVPGARGILDDGAEISELGEEVGEGLARTHGGAQADAGYTQPSMARNIATR
jgi:hypothetical protein